MCVDELRKVFAGVFPQRADNRKPVVGDLSWVKPIMAPDGSVFDD